VTADVTPFEGTSKSTSLTTESHSGRTVLTLREPYDDTDVILSDLQSRHTTVSGSLELRYPSKWEGTLAGSTVSGSLNLRGHDLKIIRDDKMGSTHRAEATKGHGNSYMHFESVSGSASITVD